MKKICMHIIIIVFVFLSYTGSISAIDREQTPPSIKGTVNMSFNVNYVGGGNEEPYVEDGITYYRSGNIIELSIIAPQNSYIVSVNTVTYFDERNLQLIDTFSDISHSIDNTLIDDFSLSVTNFDGKQNAISIRTMSYNVNNANMSGGIIAKMRFRIKNSEETKQGVRCEIDNNYDIIGYVNDQLQPISPNNYVNESDRFTVAPPITIHALKKPSINQSKPEGNKPSIVAPGDINYDNEVINQNFTPESVKAIAAITRNYLYSFNAKALSSVNGSDSYVSINDVLAKKEKVITKDEFVYKTSSFDESSQENIGNNYLNYQILFFVLSVLVVIATFTYDYYKNRQLEESLRS